MKTKNILITLIAMLAVTVLVFQSCKKDEENYTYPPVYTHGTFTDPRDGQTYATIKINSQTWFAENLNYVTSNSWSYNNDTANGNIYGRLYIWEAALTACPSGWSLPSDDQWKQMEMALGMSQKKANLRRVASSGSPSGHGDGFPPHRRPPIGVRP
jgi:hypothetical protein